MRMFAEVIASAFASGFSWGGYAAGNTPIALNRYQGIGDHDRLPAILAGPSGDGRRAVRSTNGGDIARGLRMHRAVTSQPQ